MSLPLVQTGDSVSASSPLTPLLFTRGPGRPNRGWQHLFLIIYTALMVLFLILGDWGFAACYAILAAFFALRSSDLDLFAPMSLVAHSFGIYFLLPLSLIRNRTPGTLTYICGTLIACLGIYLFLPRLNFGFGRWLGEDMRLRKSFLTIAASMQALGYAGFFLSTRLAGYSNPFGVFSSPLKYRFFMMVGGMTYVTQMLSFLLMTPVIGIALAYYMRLTSRKIFVAFIVAALFYSLATGSRGAPIGLVLEIFLVRHLLHKRISIALVLGLMLIFIPFIAVAGQYRMVKYSNQNGTLASVLSHLDAKDVVEIAFSRLDAAEMFDELLDAYHQGPRFGESYFMLPVDIVPRAFWPSKPRLPNPEMTRIVGRNDPYLDIAFDFGIFGETFINFLWVGMLAGALIVVLVTGPMQCIYEYAKAKRSPACILFCALMIFTPFVLVVSGLVETIIVSSFAFLQVLVLRTLFFKRVAGPPISALAG